MSVNGPVPWIESIDRRLQSLAEDVTEMRDNVVRSESLKSAVQSNTEVSKELLDQVRKVSVILDNHSTEIRRTYPVVAWFEAEQIRLSHRRKTVDGVISFVKVVAVFGTIGAATVAIVNFFQ